jgi:polyisoprenoid-binding protein YceI
VIRALLAALGIGLALAGAVQARPVSHDPTQVPAGTYVLDSRHASLIAKIPHMGGFSRYTLRFDKIDGGFTYDPADWRATKLTIHVDPASVDTGDARFDKQIEGFLDAARYPVITFVSTAVQADADGRGTVTGELSFHGVTRPVTLETTFNGVGPGLLGLGTRMGFSGVAHIKRSDFNETAMSQWAGDDIDLLFEVEFEKKR